MESTTDFEKLLFLYKTEGKGMSIQSFCINQGVNYRAFDKWYRSCHDKKIYPVELVDDPTEKEQNNTPCSEPSKREEPSIQLILNYSSGMSIRKNDLNYRELKNLIGKLEGIC